jgi:hypothetical protein
VKAALLVVAAALTGTTPAPAMEFNLVGNTLVMSGPVVSDDLARLKDQLAIEKVKLVLLHESPGGDLWNGLVLADRIREKQLATAVSGKCESACGMVFLGGVQRSFSNGRPLPKTMVGLHGAHDVNTKVALPQVSTRMAYVIRTMTDGRYPSDLLDRTVYPKNPSDFIYTFHPRRFRPDGVPRGVMECLKQPDGQFNCTMIPGLDAIAIGVVTEPDILLLEDEVKELLTRL